MLQIIDTQNHIIEERSLDSFLCGFRLAWELANELNHYQKTGICHQPKKLRQMPVPFCKTCRQSQFITQNRKPVPSGTGFLFFQSSLSFFTYSSLVICRAVKASFSSWACTTCRFHSSTVIRPRRFRAFRRL